MRTIPQIKESMTSEFMQNEAAAQAYGFKVGDSFSATFSKVSIENTLFYIFAAASWVLESLFDSYSTDIQTRIDQIIPHRPKWYRDKMLAFMKDKALIPDTDQYDTQGMTPEEIAAAQVVKHAVAIESEDASILTIKIAGQTDGVRGKLDAQTEDQVKAYIKEIKDAGVRTLLVNRDPDTFNCEVDIYYDPMMQPSTVGATCQAIIQSYIENLPFNGEYTNMALVDALQVVEGAKVVELRSASAMASDQIEPVPINARYVPLAGYFKIGVVTINTLVYGQ